MQNDSKYRKIASEVGEVNWSMSGWTEKMRRLEIAMGLGRVMQGATPYIQADPASSQVIKGETAIRMLAGSWGVDEVAADDAELAEEREEVKKQQQEVMKTAQEQQQADLDNTQAQTEAIRNPQEG